MERRTDNKLCMWDDKVASRMPFGQFRAIALTSRAYLSISGDKNREAAIIEDWEKITGKRHVEIKSDDTGIGKDKPVRSSGSNNKGE